jgi:hypothetical protein
VINPAIYGTLRGTNVTQQENSMTQKIGSKHVAQHRGIKERQEIYKTNVAREAVKRAVANAKYRNAVKGQPASTDAAASV